ncbi:Uncharacterised protein [Mycolicibacterium phlei]|jgi:hypothetical protein|uniref:Uncharacterized protein n=1 Tax=Mycolicibacterium phlei DSM 43239 = CCUG 21000 TaxID=1226750 RepID=A0A5N5VAC3_MYCPH|nr:hypothetical protein [Mycolicibacterium phlei]VEG09837.1 Uncharacterised protein [Mycobacteroides chelonae]AMO61730.1 hypothetical protein MPHLCCUG_02921 [Mycolicibacterium phlei]KAB7758718.1 hypothetical protein MPHL21000_04805 [Mycolicibacterium phlei DSM 43239 = CCUG 21000]KXW63636.1 hypothetical protein MPHL43070_23450 [Mycolicibacterium phlei DSM 43070]KXW67202.1 hypothetical protein MPHL43239_05940 [Mycolicibacterium phlei DSM 43239 = CCUG 21000]
MTALQDWLKSIIDTLFGNRDDTDEDRPAEPQLLERGLERC